MAKDTIKKYNRFGKKNVCNARGKTKNVYSIAEALKNLLGDKKVHWKNSKEYKSTVVPLGSRARRSQQPKTL